MLNQAIAPMEMRTHPVGDWQMNAYALICPDTNESVLIDPGNEPDELSKLVAGTKPVAILITHTHPDHIDALEAMRKQLRVPVYSAGEPHFDDVKIHTDKVLCAGDEFKVGTHTLRVYETPGHCVDQIAFEVVGTPTLIVGDAIFAGGPGRTHNAANFKILLKTLQNVVLSWPDETLCHPGHGPHFRLGDKRAAIAAFVAQDHGEFFGDAEWPS
jgi:hydroxyacylglutathione hydrolase